MSTHLPIVNSWTEWGSLEYICVGSVETQHYPDDDPFCYYNTVQHKHLSNYVGAPLGPRPPQRIKKAQEELNYLCELLQGECIKVADIQEFDNDIEQELKRKRCYAHDVPTESTEDKRIPKRKIEICRPPEARFDHLLITPWFKNYYQFGTACPRDVVITFGNTILEAPTSSRVRYFESCYYRPLINKFWESDKRIHWKTAPQPTCGDSMYELGYWKQDHDVIDARFANSGYKTALNETEVAFDAADIMRMGKDIFYKKGPSANNKGIEWLRREFPSLRFHAVHFPADNSPHLDVDLIPMRPPSSGSDGVVLINQNFPPLESEMKIFKDNDWKPLWCPAPVTNCVSPVAICSPNLNMNLLSISDHCCIIEECELPLYHFLEDLGWDVITCPLRSLNEFGGGVHCVTWDIRRDDSCKDYFPNQDYEKECQIDLNNFFDTKTYENK
jgi:glycine amidinotransferase